LPIEGYWCYNKSLEGESLLLSHLEISNFAIIEDLSLDLGPGFTIMTGETGAGKSIIIDAVHLLLGERAEANLIRSEAEVAVVEGIFLFPTSPEEELAAALRAHDLSLEEGQLILGREIRQGGRNVCRVNGRVMPLRAIQEVARGLIDIHGHGDHLSLLRPRQHVDFLDGYAGLLDARARLGQKVWDLRAVQRDLAHLREDERERARRIDLLAYQRQEIEAARLRTGEMEELEEESRLLANAEERATLVEEAYQALRGEFEGQDAALDLVGRAVASLSALAKLDPARSGQAAEVENLSDALGEVARSVRDYREEIDFSPERLRQVEERLQLIRDLKRKYGDTVEEILAFGQRAALELESISHAEERVAQLEEREASLLQEIGEQAEALSASRQEAVGRLARAVEEELEQLRMAGAEFAVDVRRQPSPDRGVEVQGERCAFDETGIDQVEFLVSPNVGEPPKPLARIASGGETSRLMLALKSVLSDADRTPTLIFDEIDAGIGGRVGSVVGRKLRELSKRHQVLCVTHLPQIASFADDHYRIRKEVVGWRTVVLAERLEEERVHELAQMMGSLDETSQRTAHEMLKRAQEQVNLG
jgi:DNA repair protein RecN (Recombination protein N)